MYAYLLCILVVIFFAGNILVGRAVNDLPPFTITFFRYVIAFVVLFPLGYRSAQKHHKQFISYWRSR
ncbi:EamA family transporter [Salicibibacter kimchii]|uniref:EamA domain-containing protein n=1 Tax=Salicibibacter kimchii TaxID=2099786 RepID=A0A345C0L9_9BACI|nr:EamA family transporter [Salicibibacter kimchii]AXF56750.1 hypothetical protein DT065_12520 [Salicibibacter kimchii]